MFSPSTTVQAFVAAGKLKALAVTGAKRSKFFPSVPTVAESGLPGYASVGWFGLLVPAHTPPAIVDQLNKAVVAIMAEKDVIEHMAKLGAEPEPQTPDEFARFINADVAKWSALVKEQNITIRGRGSSFFPPRHSQGLVWGGEVRGLAKSYFGIGIGPMSLGIL